jgi:hypothetical protein
MSIKKVEICKSLVAIDDLRFTVNTTIMAIALANTTQKISTIRVGEMGNSTEGVRDGSLATLFLSSFFLAAFLEAHVIPLLFSFTFFCSLLS